MISRVYIKLSLCLILLRLIIIAGFITITGYGRMTTRAMCFIHSVPSVAEPQTLITCSYIMNLCFRLFYYISNKVFTI